MIHHISIPARDPRHVADVLAELIGGRAYPFSGPLPGAYMAVTGDKHGTMIEVYEEDIVLAPGDAELPVQFTKHDAPFRLGPFHALISVPLTSDEIQRLGDREGWRTRFFGRGRRGQPPAFHLFEVWVENRVPLEVVPSGLEKEYEECIQFERLDAMFAAT